MRTKKLTYCEYAFWKEFFSYERDKDMLRDYDKYKSWLDFRSFLGNASLHFDIELAQIDHRTKGGKALMKIFHERGGANLFFEPEAFPKDKSAFSVFDEQLANSLWLTTRSTEECLRLSCSYGILMLNVMMVLSARHLYKRQSVHVQRSWTNIWRPLFSMATDKPSMSISNCMIIVDRYLFKNGFVSLENNLKVVLDALLPHSLDKRLVMSIWVFAECSDLTNAKCDLSELVKSIRPSLNFTITINGYYTHDRYILTNNLYLQSPGGFDIIGEEGTAIRNTDIESSFPFLDSGTDDGGTHAYLGRITEVMRLCRYATSCHPLLNYYNDRKEMNKRFNDKYGDKYSQIAPFLMQCIQ